MSANLYRIKPLEWEWVEGKNARGWMAELDVSVSQDRTDGVWSGWTIHLRDCNGGRSISGFSTDAAAKQRAEEIHQQRIRRKLRKYIEVVNAASVEASAGEGGASE